MTRARLVLTLIPYAAVFSAGLAVGAWIAR